MYSNMIKEDLTNDMINDVDNSVEKIKETKKQKLTTTDKVAMIQLTYIALMTIIGWTMSHDIIRTLLFTVITYIIIVAGNKKQYAIVIATTMLALLI